jgi:hypothetical protein
LIPLIVCWSLSVRSDYRIGFLTRATYGFAQAILLMYVYFPWRLADGLWTMDPAGCLRQIAIMSVLYATIFGVVTQVLSYAIARMTAPVPGACEECGYSLKGLTVPRCPECGEAFDPRSLAARHPPKQDAPPPMKS